ncbi:hypothetical protein DFH09DRAFT_1394532 [Mycena vulgaris]|nr:hypothetical protein DFH09DRAFT_1394532 [Mycena vulgaris]
MSISITLAAFPEELLERILAHVVVAPSTPHPRAPWHLKTQSTDIRTCTAALLVSRAFYRIGLPHFYHTLVLHSPSQAQSLLETLTADPALARCVRALVLPEPCPAAGEVLRRVGPSLRALDLTLPPALPAPDVVALCASLSSLQNLCTLTVRKAAGTYLSQPSPRAVLAALASAAASCPELEHLTTTFPLSADPALAPLTNALAAAPALHTLRTPPPALWAPPFLAVAANPALRRICLDSASPSSPSSSPAPRARPPLASGLFLVEARKHARLSELIRAGTPVIGGGWRGRAWTVGAAGADSVVRDGALGLGARDKGEGARAC